MDPGRVDLWWGQGLWSGDQQSGLLPITHLDRGLRKLVPGYWGGGAVGVEVGVGVGEASVGDGAQSSPHPPHWSLP